MHIGKLMARLNAKNVRFDVGSGGIPELTSTDIAAALGMVKDELGRELLCRVWWPDGARRTTRQLEFLLEQRQFAQWSSRETDMLHATLAVAEHTGGESMRRAQGLYAEAHANRWPRWLDNAELGTKCQAYGNIRRAVLFEVSQTHQCGLCHGHGELTHDHGLVKTCEACDGTGLRATSDRWRARMIGLDESTYRRSWRPVYEWTLGLCVDAVQNADRMMRAAVA